MVDKKKAVAGAYFQRCYKWEGAISFSIIKKKVSYLSPINHFARHESSSNMHNWVEVS